MNGPQHYAEAERLLAEATAYDERVIHEDDRSRSTVGGWRHQPQECRNLLDAAQVHATLALVAVTAEAAFDPQGRPLIDKSDATYQWEQVL